jgi:hypothetical protein
MLNKKKILAHYNLFKKYAFRSFEQNSIDQSVKCIEVAAHIGYKYNFKYCDDELESLIQKIERKINQNQNSFEPVQNKIVLYDSFAIDNRGLTQQYIDAIKRLNFDILFIYSSNSIGANIERELLDYDKVKIVHLNENTFKENVYKAIKEIEAFRPAYILQHFSPWDILGFVLSSSITSSKRYLINLTDHAFWLGKSCTDYFLEFRNYGIYLSVNQRGIPIEKLLFQSYYPIQSETLFRGFPEEVEGKKIVFAGSSFYKIYGKNGIFLKMAKRILEDNEDVIFLFAGSGNDKPLKTFIENNGFQHRFLMLGDRLDINEVIKRVDVYLNTYPMIGGLMSQFAAVHNKPIIGYTDADLYSFNDTEDLLQVEAAGMLVKDNFDEFYLAINSLIRNEAAASNNISITNNCVISPSDFTKQLYLNLTTPMAVNVDFVKSIRIDLNAVFDLYVDMEVNFLNEHYILIWNKLKYNILKYNIIIGIKAVVIKLKHKLKY